MTFLTRLGLLLLVTRAMDAQAAKVTSIADDAESCKTTCQRFGMQAIAAHFEAIGNRELAGVFGQTSSPVECSAKCEEAFAGAGAKLVPGPAVAAAFLQQRLRGRAAGQDRNEDRRPTAVRADAFRVVQHGHSGNDATAWGLRPRQAEGGPCCGVLGTAEWPRSRGA
eukprot:CAMPEP_0168437844 /NCGR_PEP_ID=MMETSP0228-20121227/41651_1 /TAXON_ID=133427 /ORGANISM="Protoceratium reticulatum, Strain CCCM 535 (=CCMP 1889)" /LENGTH=166 /DNA_ID=CAMNT_0008452085 /DNA_START=51 /DNA_END=548 /DNA_ORIENTATION=-